MERIASFLLRHKAGTLVTGIVLSAVCALLMLTVRVNYDLTGYLPDAAPSTRALAVLSESYASGVPNLNVFVPCDSIPEALEYKAAFGELDCVLSVLWLDDTLDVTEPLEMADEDAVKAWYVPGTGALFMLTVDDADYGAALSEIRAVAGEDAAICGEAADFDYVQNQSMGEIANIMLYAVPLILVVLLLATDSFLEPVLFLLVIGAAILLNMGTNVFLGEISYVTQACSSILQLAVSMDYAIFLLHAFARHRETEPDVTKAMKAAMVEAAPAIAASMVTTLFGFLSLCLMKFKLGGDMGIVLAKGVLLSYLAVIGLLPVAAIYAEKWLDRTRHRSLIPSFAGFSKVVMKLRVPALILVLLAVVPCFLASRSNSFIYGSAGFYSEDSPVRQQADFISETFGSAQQLMLLVPEGRDAEEALLCEDLAALDGVSTVVGYATAVGVQIPDEVPDPESLSALRCNGWSRIILYTNAEEESDYAFAQVEAIRAAAERYYGEDAHLLGRCAVNYDLMDTVTGDNLTITLAAILSIGIVLLLTFRNGVLPFVLLLTIEGAVWLNLSIPYFAGDELNFIGYQIISSVQLGATVDYGILMTEHWRELRLENDRREAVQKAVAMTAPSILTPALIIYIACKILGVVSSNGVISQMGSILGRGALISLGMVLFFLPAALLALDGPILRTDLKRKKTTNGSETEAAG